MTFFMAKEMSFFFQRLEHIQPFTIVLLEAATFYKKVFSKIS